MLVEDDNNLREIYGARLMAEGYEIVSAADGEEALALAVKEKPDLIISDVMMPKISGFDMLDILRTTAETKNTKIIMMTALSQPEDRQRGESLGADKYLVKSQVTLEDVVVAVHDILGDSSAGAAAPEPAVAPAEPAQGPASMTNPTQPVEPSASTPIVPPADGTSSTDEPLPKAEGASDAPEPASRKPKIIQPINDIHQDSERLMQLAAAEDALEIQADQINAQLQTNKELVGEISTAHTSSDNNEDSSSDEAISSDTTNNAVINPVKLAEEKQDLMKEIDVVANSGVIEQEAAQTESVAPLAAQPAGETANVTAPVIDPSIAADEAAAAAMLKSTQRPSTTPTSGEPPITALASTQDTAQAVANLVNPPQSTPAPAEADLPQPVVPPAAELPVNQPVKSDAFDADIAL